MLNKSFNRIDLISKALDGAWLKNTAIANNIANVNTPGYKKQVVEFESILRNELNKNVSVKMNTTHTAHMDATSSQNPQISTQSRTSYRVDDNNVDVDVENAEMAKNTIYYNALIDQVNGQYNRIKTVLNIGK